MKVTNVFNYVLQDSFLICRVCPFTHNFDFIMISHVAQTYKITQIEPFEQYSSMLALFAFHNPTEWNNGNILEGLPITLK